MTRYYWHECIEFLEFLFSSYRLNVHFRRDSRRFPCDAFSVAGDVTYGWRVMIVQRVLVWAVVQAWSCTIVESY